MKKGKPQPEIKAVLFDLGNVLVNYDIQRAVRRFAKACRVPIARIWLHFILSQTEKAYTCGRISSYEYYRQTSRMAKVKIPYARFRHYWNDIFWENRGMEALLQKLKKRYPLYLISNTNDMHFSHIKRNYRLLRHFKKTFPSHEVGHRKPHPEIYEHVLKAIRRKPGETVFIDDTPAFVRGARKAGMYAVRFRDKKKLIRDLEKLGVEA
ncbi:MAG: HAD family phosphatase [Candidatus Omnitrophica bacterium]|nr:HAD family phosphatase [Candidatus Omnitrophota bacterium]MDD5670491.1 HAD family phosphatase [Candidatus Omnitrophota bacterium]